ncbi:fused MFS/spermidine synthase, partial [Candidatus Uhrbacteria bacterium]|nr:fused MFS/spermidine synthase [Candidatus Uhrbacteria bacterium]
MWSYRITTFLTGAAIMVAEIGAARAMAPYFGTSIVVWTNVIGSILVALSVGYWVGGRWVERCPSRRVLGAIIMSAGALLLIPGLATPAIAGWITGGSTWFRSGFLSLFAGSLGAIVFLFAIPIGLLGMVSPFVLKLAARERNDIGALAGQLSAIATIGSLVG